MSRPLGALLALLALGCSVETEDLRGLPDACTASGACAEGFVCEQRRCVRAPGAACFGDEPTLECGRPMGVCAGARHACVAGRVEQSCREASFGPRYEPSELSCDGEDNDCDGFVDAASTRLEFTPDAAFYLVAPRGQGYTALSRELNFQGDRWSLSLRLRLLDAGRQALGEPLTLDQVAGEAPVDLVWSSVAGDTVALWQVHDAGAAPLHRIAKVAHPEGAARLEVAARDLVSPAQVVGMPRLARAHDGASLLVAWPTPAGVVVQVLSPALEPLTGQLLLEGAPRALAASAHGPSGFAVGWARGDGAVLHFRALSAALAPVDQRDLAVSGAVSALQLFSLAADRQPVAAWLRSGGAAPVVERLQPFGAQVPVLVLESASTVRLDATLLPTEELVLSYPRATGAGTWDVLLRTVAPDGAARERVLATGAPFWSTQLMQPSAGGAVLAMELRESRPVMLAPCAP